jgi:hypothetical protein
MLGTSQCNTITSYGLKNVAVTAPMQASYMFCARLRFDQYFQHANIRDFE